MYSVRNAGKGSAKPRLFLVSKPHTHITYMLRQCTSIVYVIFVKYLIFCDISAFYFGADFPFNIVLYDVIHYLWVTMQPVMNILLNLFT